MSESPPKLVAGNRGGKAGGSAELGGVRHGVARARRGPPSRARTFMRRGLPLLTAALLLAAAAAAAPPQKECPVCLEVVGLLQSAARELSAKRKASAEDMAQSIHLFCHQGKLDTSEAQMCYIIEPLKHQLAKWGGLGMETARICAKLDSANGETCALRRDWRADDKRQQQALEEPWAPESAAAAAPRKRKTVSVGKTGVVYD